MNRSTTTTAVPFFLFFAGIVALCALLEPAALDAQVKGVCRLYCGSPSPPSSPPPPRQPTAEEIERERQEKERQRREEEALAWNEKGLEAWKRRDWAAAVAHFRKALELKPQSDVIKDNLRKAEAQLRMQEEKKLQAEREAKVREGIAQLAASLSAPTGGNSGLDFASAPGAATSQLEFAGADKPSSSQLGFAKNRPSLVGPRPAEAPQITRSAAAVHADLQKVRAQVRGMQEALRRLDRSLQLDQSQRKEWESATEEAVRGAWRRGQEMAFGAALDYIHGGLEGQFQEADKEVRYAVDLLAGETDPARRERLHAAIKLLDQERSDIREGMRVMQHAREAAQIAQFGNWATSKADDLEKSTEGAYSLLEKSLNEPTVQKALKVGQGYGQVLSQSRSILDSGYDISVEAVSIKRIGELNRNSESYLKAIRKLRETMIEKVQTIKALEQELRQQNAAALKAAAARAREPRTAAKH